MHNFSLMIMYVILSDLQNILNVSICVSEIIKSTLPYFSQKTSIKAAIVKVSAVLECVNNIYLLLLIPLELIK